MRAPLIVLEATRTIASEAALCVALTAISTRKPRLIALRKRISSEMNTNRRYRGDNFEEGQP